MSGHLSRKSGEIYLAIVSIALTLSVFACTDDQNIEPRSGLLDEYSPLNEGEVRTYVVDSVTYDYDGLQQRIVIDTQQYYIQERILESIDIQEEPWWRIGLFRSTSLDGNYQLTDYVYMRNTGSQLLRKEGNLTFVPLASPLERFTEWDGTAHFNSTQANFFIRGEVIAPYADWSYLYLRNWDVYEVDDRTYENVIQVNQKDTASINVDQGGGYIQPEKQLFYTLANEYYAPNVGLIEKKEVHLTSICASANGADFQVFCDTTTIFENAERGYIYHKKLVSIE